MLAHLDGRKPFGNKVLGELWRYVVCLPRMVIVQRHAVDNTSGRARDPNPHTGMNLQSTCHEQAPRQRASGLLAAVDVLNQVNQGV
jgi:hypothetical protein